MAPGSRVSVQRKTPGVSGTTGLVPRGRRVLRAPRADGHRALGGKRGRLLRQRLPVKPGAGSGRIHHRAVQKRCHPSFPRKLVLAKAGAGTGAGRGVTAKRWNSPPSNGGTGTITGACSNPSGMCLRLRSRHIVTTNCKSRRWLPDPSKSPSGKPGAVHREPDLHPRTQAPWIPSCSSRRRTRRWTTARGARRRWWPPLRGLHAVRHTLSFERYLAENGYTDVRPLVAFSGMVRDPDTGIERHER